MVPSGPRRLSRVGVTLKRRLRVSRLGCRFKICKSIKGVRMELSFACENSADASYLAQELELTLRRQGIPAEAMMLKPSSSENMDIGSVLWVSIETANQILGPVSSIASLATCIYEIATKYNSGVIFEEDESRVKIPVTKINMTRIESVLTRYPKPKPKAKSRT